MLRGRDGRLPYDKKTDRTNHTVANVYRSMLWQIHRDYGTLTDPRAMTLGEIGFWYDGLRPELRERTKRKR